MSIFRRVAAFAVLIVLCGQGTAQSEEFNWNVLGGGSHNWATANNWEQAGFPNSNLAVANLAVPLTNDLTVSLGSSNVTVAALSLGGTGSPVTTDLTATTGSIQFSNVHVNPDFDGDRIVDGHDFLRWQRGFGSTGAQATNARGNANRDQVIDAVDLAIWEQHYGTVDFQDSLEIWDVGAIHSGGTPGSTNIISAPVRLGNQQVAVTNNSTNDLRITGPLQLANVEFQGNLYNHMSTDYTLTIDSDFDFADVVTGNNRALQIGGGVTILNGNISSTGVDVPGENLRFWFGGGRVEIYGDNTFTGRSFLRSNIMVGSNSAFGDGANGAVVTSGGTLISNSHDRVLDYEMQLQANQGVSGEYSLEWAGDVWQSNTRSWVNNLQPGAVLTLSGRQFPNETIEDPPEPGRYMTFTGPGTTHITGGFYDEFNKETQQANPGNFIGNLRKEGTGLLVVSGGNSNYSGETLVRQGNLRFDTNADFSGTSTIIVHFGAVGVGSGVVNNSDFLTRLNSSAAGGLMLASHESNEDLNFNTFPLSSAAHMTVAAPETGMTYTGTITPSTTHNTYRLGGGEGTLTLPNNNQLTGANGLYVSNGGEVHITGTNDFTGKTEVISKYIDGSNTYAGTVLAVTHLADGGTPSGLGSATSDAENIFIRGSTLKYVGGAATTDRLFTIGTGGAILDASGTGAVHFTNAGALGMEVAPDRQAQTDGFSGFRNRVTHMPNTDDLVIGMPISGLVNPTTGFGNYEIPEGAQITSIRDSTSIDMNRNVAIDTFASNGTLIIGDYLRTLTLAGSNADDNTLNALVADSPQGPVGITKTGTGKWVLSNSSNAYSGPTRVEEGVLSLTAAFLGENSEVHLTTGATLDLNFAGLDTIGALYIDGEPQAVGTWGGPGSGAANISNLFTGMGRLGVSVLGASMQAVPEPGSLMLAVGSLLAFVARGRRRLV